MSLTVHEMVTRSSNLIDSTNSEKIQRLLCNAECIWLMRSNIKIWLANGMPPSALHLIDFMASIVSGSNLPWNNGHSCSSGSVAHSTYEHKMRNIWNWDSTQSAWIKKSAQFSLEMINWNNWYKKEEKTIFTTPHTIVCCPFCRICRILHRLAYYRDTIATIADQCQYISSVIPWLHTFHTSFLWFYQSVRPIFVALSATVSIEYRQKTHTHIEMHHLR